MPCSAGSLGSFSASFKKQTGPTPSAYRDRHVGRGAALIPGCYAMLWCGGIDAPGGDGPEGSDPEDRNS